MPLKTITYKVNARGLSEVGLVRANNEDVWSALHDHGFFILADGMGGHKAGEIASNETVDRLLKLANVKLKKGKLSLDKSLLAIEEMIRQVNEEVNRMGASDKELRGMGTTLCCLYFHAKGVVYAHVGDSRIYRLRNAELKQMTSDHSLVTEMIELGELSEKRARGVKYKNIITRAIGTQPFVEVTAATGDVQVGDTFMLCSDGLSDIVSPEKIHELLKAPVDMERKVESLVEAALLRGGRDNITVVVMQVEGA